MADKLCLRRKEVSAIPTMSGITSIAHSTETFAPCLGEKCPLHVVSDDLENKSFCIDILILDAQLTNLVYGNPQEKKPDKSKSKFVKCSRCECGYGNPESGLCAVCEKIVSKNPKPSDSQR